jgi:CubicO group peptidase (beta-lactamase class C family)
LLFQPGSQWKYSPGLTICGRIVEVVAGQPFEKFLEQRMFRPLKMDSTTFYPSTAQRQRIATLYRPGEQEGTIQSTGHWIIDPSDDRMPNPSAGLYSPAADMARFYQMVLRGGELDGQRIVSASAIEQMSTIKTGKLEAGFDPGHGWGLGCCIVRKPQGVTAMLSPGTFGHGGAFGTQGWIDPHRGQENCKVFFREPSHFPLRSSVHQGGSFLQRSL